MRVSTEEKHKSRARIIRAASRQFRQAGIAETGLAEVMRDAGMTHGGFYKHFADKDALVGAALADAFVALSSSLSALGDLSTSEGFRHAYLSSTHRDNPGLGCPVAALGSEVARASPTLREAMTTGVEAMLAHLQSGLAESSDPRADAIRELSSLVGALVVARAVAGPLSEEVLAAARNRSTVPN